MNVYSLSSLIASSFCIALGAFIFIKRRRDRKCRFFGIASISTGLWSSFPFSISIAPDQQSALIVARFIYIFAILTPPAWLHFILSVVKEKWSKHESGVLILSYCLSAPFILYVFNPVFIKDVIRFAPHFSVVPGPLYALFVAVFCLIFSLVIETTFRNFRITSGYQRNQLKFILLSYIFGFLSGILHFGAAYFNKEPVSHDIFLIGYTGLIAYAILKYRIMDISVTVTRTGIFVAVYTTVLGMPFVLAVYGRDWLNRFLGVNWWIGPLVLLTLLATCGPFVYIYLQKRAEAILLRGQRKYQENLKSAARELARIHNLRNLLDLIVHIVTKIVRISRSSIYLRDEDSGRFILKASRNLKEGQAAFLEINDPLTKWFYGHKEPLVYEEISRMAEDESDGIFKELRQKMGSLNASLIVPGFIKDKLLGFLVLGEKRSGGFYTSEDLNTFAVLANQAALAIENALLYENMEELIKKRTEQLVAVQKQLVQAEKLATVGTLAGGVAHEINNPLTAILTNVQMLLMSEELDKESLELIEEATKRCRTIVQKLMTYAKKPLEAAEISEVDLLKVAGNVISFLAYQMEQDGIRVTVEAGEDPYLVMGNLNELEQVITNIILNAKDAIKQVRKAGIISVSFSRGDGWVRMKIQDNGAGIPAEIVSKIFDPFFTTKDVGKGTGLGLSISQSIIEKHKGSITVQSELNKGSVFTIALPCAKVLSNV